MDRREMLASALAGTACAAAGPARGAAPRARGPRPSELDEATVAELQDRMGRGELSAHALTRHYLRRIEQANLKGPTMRAVIQTNPEALAVARSLDRERRQRGPRGLLHGIPVLVKDNIETADPMPTTAGSLALREHLAAEDAVVVRRLRAAGAVILGKANLSEWANFRSTHSSSGWSAVGGQCRNPYALDRSPVGSSSGSAVGVAANLAALAVGTETDGSITSPSSACSVVGVKPTHGLLSLDGIVPIAHSQDTAGPIARTVGDAALLLGVLAGGYESGGEADGSLRDYTAALDPEGLRGARIGVARESFGDYPRVTRLIEQRIETMRGLGAEVIDPVEVTLGDSGEYEVLLHEFKHDLNRYLSGLGPKLPVRSLAELIAFNERHSEEEMPHFAQEHFEEAERRGPLTDETYLKARSRWQAAGERVREAFRRHRLDAVVSPTLATPWLIDLVNGDQPGSSPGTSSLAAVSGLPHVTVPAGYVRGLPVGLSFIGRPHGDAELLRLAYAFEQATMCRVPPRFLATADAGEP